MKKIFKSLLTVFVSLTMLFSLTVNVAASESTVSSDEQRLISEILTYFSYSKGGILMNIMDGLLHQSLLMLIFKDV